MKSIFEQMFPWNKYQKTGRGGYDPHNIGTASSPKIQPGPNAKLPKFRDPIEINSFVLDAWQQQLIRVLETGTDTYILAGAGSGKTPPVINFWVNNILGINTTQPQDIPNMQNIVRLLTAPETIPQVLWLVPIKNLSANIEQEQKERFVKIILQVMNRIYRIDPATNNLVLGPGNALALFNRMGRFGGMDQVRLIESMIINDNQIPNDKILEFKAILGELIKVYVERNLIGRIEEGVNTVAINNTRGNPLKPFVIAIYESAENIIDDFDNLRLILFDEAQRVQGGSQADDKRAQQIGKSIHKILFNNNGRKAQIIMLSGSTSPTTAANVTHYFNMTYGRNFEPRPYQPPRTAKNPSDINVIAASHLTDKSEQLRRIYSYLSGRQIEKDGIVFLIFSKARINEIIDTIAPVHGGSGMSGTKLSTSKKRLYNYKSDVTEISSPGDIDNISNDRLRRAASNGIGYLYRPEEVIDVKTQRDVTIIQNLFLKKEIKIILATDAVREGINITCNVLYLPTTTLPQQGEMDNGSLAQLVNRVGRKRDKSATIYTSPECVDKVRTALIGDPSEFGEEPFVLPDGSGIKAKYRKLEAGANYTINTSVQAGKEIGQSALNLGRGLLKIFT